MSNNEGENWFGGLGSASVDGKGSWFNPGTYKVSVEDVIRKLSENPDTEGDRMFIVETTILETLAAMDADVHPTTKEVLFAASNQPGERCSMVVKLGKRKGSPLSKVKAFMVAVTGMAAHEGTDQEWVELAMDLTDPAVPIAERLDGLNRELIVVASKTFTNKGAPFTPLQWLAIPEEDDE